MSRFLSDVEESIQSVTRRFAQTEIRPRRLEAYDGDEFARQMVKRSGELGLLGLKVPEQFGGTELSTTAVCVVMEELGRESPGVAIPVLVTIALVPSLLATSKLTGKYLAGVLSGDLVMAGAFSDPAGIVNYAEQPNIATRDGSDYVLDGTRTWVSQGTFFDLVLVAGLCDGNLRGFFLDRNTPGLSVSPIRKMGLGTPWGMLTLNGCRVPEEMSFDMSELVKNRQINLAATNSYLSMLFISAIALGAADRVLEITIDYVSSRTAGKKVVASMQAIQHKIVRIKANIEAGRSMLYTAAKLQDQGRSDAILNHLVKPWVTEMAVDAIQDCMTLHGGTGYAFETGIEGYLRDALGTLIGENTAEMLHSTTANLMGLPGAEAGSF